MVITHTVTWATRAVPALATFPATGTTARRRGKVGGSAVGTIHQIKKDEEKAVSIRDAHENH